MKKLNMTVKWMFVVLCMFFMAVMAHCLRSTATSHTRYRRNLEKLPNDYKITSWEEYMEEKNLTEYYDMKVEGFYEKAKKIKPGTTLFVGDSVIDILDRKVYYPGLQAAQQGISGDTTRGVLNRMDVIYAANPAVIDLHIGANDIMNEHRTAENIAASFDQILRELMENLPDTRIIVESIYPGRDGTYYQWADRKQDVVDTNVLIKELAEKYGLRYVDMYSELVDNNGLIKEEYCEDGIHPNASGYELISAKLRPIIEEELKLCD